MEHPTKSPNFITLSIFAPVLILTGILGFVIPPHAALMSGETPYNIFHIVFGIIGLTLVLTKLDTPIRYFNIGFGAIDLYQAVASYLHLFPLAWFKWTMVDDILHVLIGAGLILVGLYKFPRG